MYVPKFQLFQASEGEGLCIDRHRRLRDSGGCIQRGKLREPEMNSIQRTCFSFAMAISPWSAEEITVIVLQMEVNMDINASPRKCFEIIGGNPMSVWIVLEMADLNSKCTLFQMPNRFLY